MPKPQQKGWLDPRPFADKITAPNGQTFRAAFGDRTPNPLTVLKDIPGRHLSSGFLPRSQDDVVPFLTNKAGIAKDALEALFRAAVHPKVREETLEYLPDTMSHMGKRLTKKFRTGK